MRDGWNPVTKQVGLMPHRSGRLSEQDTSISIISSVFSFVSREFESFVTNATGGATEEDEDYEDDEDDYEENPEASSSRVLPPSLTQSRSRHDRYSTENRRHQNTSQTPRQKAKSRDHSTHLTNGLTPKKTTKRSRSKSAVRRRIPSPLPNDEEELSGSERSPSPAPISAPSPIYISRRRGIVSMPGSFYERSESLQPSPEPENERSRVVRFAPDVVSPPVSKKLSTPRTRARHESEAGPSTPLYDTPRPKNKYNQDYVPSSSPDTVPVKTPSKPPRQIRRIGSVEVINLVDEDDDNGSQVSDQDVNEGPGTGYDSNASVDQEEEEFTESESDSEAEESFQTPTIDKGEKKEVVLTENPQTYRSPSRHNSDRYDTHESPSFESRLRNIQQERDLLTGRQEAKGLEDHPISDVLAEERARDKERIRVLEEELKRLKEELAKRPVSALPYFIPPPPPPPPPPSSLSIQVPSKQASSLLSDVRASLKHTATPHEKPINPVYGGAPKQKGQPTVNVGADMMAAFLTELKTHRLRKIGNYQDRPSTTTRSQPAIRVREVGDVGNRSEFMIRPRDVEEVGNMTEILPRSSTAGIFKQKETYDSESSNLVNRPTSFDSRNKRKPMDDIDPIPTKKRNTAPTQNWSTDRDATSNHMSVPRVTTSSSAIEQPAPKPVYGGYHHSSDSSCNSRLFSSSSQTETNITTPSLCSDNDQENGVHEDRSPPTPPQVFARSKVQSRDLTSNGIKDSFDHSQHLAQDDHDNEMSTSHYNHSRDILDEVSSHKSQDSNPFANRPVNKRLESPRRPPPPARLKANNAPQVDLDHEDVDNESTVLDSWNQSSFERATDSSPLRLPIRPPAGTFKPPSRIPIRRGPMLQNRNKPQPSHDVSRSLPSVSEMRSRRNSLASELHRAEEVFEADIYNDEVYTESGTYESIGMRGRKEGFLAHGGAGGIPVLMSKGYVEGIDDMYDFDYEES